MAGNILGLLTLASLLTYIRSVQFIVEPKKETCILEDVPINQVNLQPPHRPLIGPFNLVFSN
jgi:hypothetical protein